MDAESVEDFVSAALGRERLVNLAARLTPREEIHGDMEEDAGSEPEHQRTDDSTRKHALGGRSEDGDAEWREPDACGGKVQHRRGALLADESPRRGVSDGTFMRDDGETEAVTDGVTGEPGDHAEGDAEPAERRVVIDGPGNDKGGGAGDHRAACEAVSPR